MAVLESKVIPHFEHIITGQQYLVGLYFIHLTAISVSA